MLPEILFIIFFLFSTLTSPDSWWLAWPPARWWFSTLILTSGIMSSNRDTRHWILDTGYNFFRYWFLENLSILASCPCSPSSVHTETSNNTSEYDTADRKERLLVFELLNQNSYLNMRKSSYLQCTQFMWVNFMCRSHTITLVYLLQNGTESFGPSNWKGRSI